MKNRLISTVILMVMGLMLFAPVANAQVFYFNTQSNSFQTIISNNGSITQSNADIKAPESKIYTQLNQIFYFFTRKNTNTTTQPSTPAAPAPSKPEAPVVEEEKPNQPVQPAQPAKPEQPAKPVTQPSQPSQNTETNNIVNAEELKMLEYINNERAKAGVAPLQMDTEVARVAQIKSQDMVDNNYFSHTSPTYGSPFDMMKNFGITYRAAGENIAKNSTMLKAHTALMNSEGHRNNILNPNYTHIGIGIVQNKSTSGITVTQMFIRK